MVTHVFSFIYLSHLFIYMYLFIYFAYNIPYILAPWSNFSVYHKDRCTGPEVSVPAGQGVLSSSVSDSTGCGSMASPWSIKLAPGQRLSLSLVDFGWGDHSSGGVGQNRCDPYAYVVEKAVAVNQSVCGGGDRQRHVYTSTSSHVLIQTVPARHRNAEFLLYFTGNHFDCETRQFKIICEYAISLKCVQEFKVFHGVKAFSNEKE